MRLHAIAVENIRSYAHARIPLEDGITLLSGDIGSGKSTLLQALELALFGMNRGEGDALLRHGTDRGSVTLEFEVDGAAYAICRTLKRTKTGVVQDAGWIETGGAREALSPVELKARVFSLIGYPLQYLSRKNLLYRFTIYTPQEEMKRILDESPEERLETIRRVFGVDTYKAIAGHAQLLVRAFRAREQADAQLLDRVRHELAGMDDRLTKEPALLARRAALTDERTRLVDAVAALETARERAEQARALIEQERNARAMQARARDLLRRELAELTVQRAAKERQLAPLTAQLAAPVPATQDPAPLEREARDVQAELAALQEERGRALAIIDECAHGPEVAAGETCPTCRQVVPPEHLASLRGALDAKGNAARKKRARIEMQLAERTAALAALTRSLDESRAAREQVARRALLQSSADGLAVDVRKLTLMIEERTQGLAALSPDDPGLDARARDAAGTVVEAKQRLERARTQSLDAEKGLAALEQEIAALAALREQRALVEAERARLEDARARHAHLRAWLDDRFQPFIEMVEREMLLAIHTTFDAAFRDWFCMLVEDDALVTRLDQRFSPVVQQQGYEMDASALSGGERTALALAYRLAIVQAIHALLPHLGTAGLLVLDEPTDGFSSEQLSRMRDVLRELALAQVILVSHEPQLEAFVDHVLRVEKTAAGSQVTLA